MHVAARTQDELEDRALILAPRGRDASIAASLLTEGGVSTELAADIGHLVRELGRGAGLVLASLSLGSEPLNLLPIIVYNLTQHLVAGGAETLLRRTTPH